MATRAIDRFMEGARTPEGKIIAVLLAMCLALMSWNVTAIGYALSSKDAVAGEKEAVQQKEALQNDAKADKKSDKKAEAKADNAEASKAAKAEQKAAEPAPSASSTEKAADASAAKADEGSAPAAVAPAPAPAADEPAAETPAADKSANDSAATDSTVGAQGAESASAEGEAATENEQQAEAENADKDAKGKEDDADMPAASFTGSANGVSVFAEAPQGAFPKGTKMRVEPVQDESVADAVSDAVESDPSVSGEVISVVTVDITFYDKDGKEIEPAKPIEVSLSANAVSEAKADAEKDFAIVHVDDNGSASVVAEDASAAVNNDEVAFKSDEFSKWSFVTVKITGEDNAAGEPVSSAGDDAPEGWVKSDLYNLAEVKVNGGGSPEWYRLGKTLAYTAKSIDYYVDGLKSENQKVLDAGAVLADDYVFGDLLIDSDNNKQYKYGSDFDVFDQSMANYAGYYTVKPRSDYYVAVKNKIGGYDDKTKEYRWLIAEDDRYADPNETDSFHRNFSITVYPQTTEIVHQTMYDMLSIGRLDSSGTQWYRIGKTGIDAVPAKNYPNNKVMRDASNPPDYDAPNMDGYVVQKDNVTYTYCSPDEMEKQSDPVPCFTMDFVRVVAKNTHGQNQYLKKADGSINQEIVYTDEDNNNPYAYHRDYKANFYMPYTINYYLAGTDVNGTDGTLLSSVTKVAQLDSSVSAPEDVPEGYTKAYDKGGIAKISNKAENNVINVYCAPADVTITTASNEWVYDGENHFEAKAAVTYGGKEVAATAGESGSISYTLPTGDTLNVQVTGSVKDVTDEPVSNTFTYELENADRYPAVSTECGTLSVTKRPVKLTSESIEKAYAGNALTNSHVTVYGMKNGEWVERDGVFESEARAVATGSQQYVGDTLNDIKISKLGDSNYKESNYSMVLEPGTITVTASENNSRDVVKKTHEIALGQTYALGDTVTFDIDVANIYAQVMTATVTEKLPNAVFEDDASVATLENMEAGEKRTLHATYEISEADIAAGKVVNSVEVAFPDASATFAGIDTVTELDGQEYNYSVIKQIVDPKAEYGIGDTISYDIEVANIGNQTQDGIQVSDELADAAGAIEFTSLPEGATADGNVVTLGTMAPGQTATIEAAYTVQREDANGSIANAAVVSNPNITGTPTRDDEAEKAPVVADYPLTVNYVYAADGSEAQPAVNGLYLEGEAWSVDVPLLSGYASSVNGVALSGSLSGSKLADSEAYTVLYTPIAEAVSPAVAGFVSNDPILQGESEEQAEPEAQGESAAQNESEEQAEPEAQGESEEQAEPEAQGESEEQAGSTSSTSSTTRTQSSTRNRSAGSRGAVLPAAAAPIGAAAAAAAGTVPAAQIAIDEDGNPLVQSIEDEGNALASGVEGVTASMAGWSLFNVIAAAIAIVLGIIMLIGLFRRRDDEQEPSLARDRNIVTRVAGGLVALLALILLLAAQDFTLPMVIFDQSSPIFAADAVANIALAALSRKKSTPTPAAA